MSGHYLASVSRMTVRFSKVRHAIRIVLFCFALSSGVRPVWADSAVAILKHNLNITVGFFSDNFQPHPLAPDFTVVFSPTAVGAGSLSSSALHGPTDAKPYPVAPIFIQNTSSVGDSETSNNKVRYNIYAEAGGEYITLPSPETGSRSEASSSLGIAHDSRSDSDTTVLKTVEMTRTTSGLLDALHLNLAVKALPDAMHLSATKVGNASAFAQVTLSIIGNIQDLTDPGSVPTDLVPKEVFSHRVDADGEWISTGWDNRFFLDVPFYTRVAGAHFKLNLGLRLQTITFANVNSPVPEPACFPLFGVGAVAVFSFRRRK